MKQNTTSESSLIVRQFPCAYSYHSVSNNGSVLVLRTNENAPQYKVITVDLGKDGEKKDFIPETNAFLTGIDSANKGNNFVVTYKRDVRTATSCLPRRPC